MHTFLLIAAYLSATTLATPVAQLFDSFEEESASPTNQQEIKNLPEYFTNKLGGLPFIGQQEGDNNAPLSFLTGDTTRPNYLQAQVPSQDTFSNFGAGCPSEKLFCCQGGSGPPGTLIQDASFKEKCIPYNDENTLDDKCQVESNGSCCQPENAPGGVTVWQCVTTPIKVVPRKQESDDESQTTQSAPGQPDNSAQDRPITPPARSNLDRPTIPLRNHGKSNWESL